MSSASTPPEASPSPPAPHSSPADDPVNLDDVLEAVGPFGRAQKWLYLMICLLCSLTAFATLASVFTAAEPDHRCRVEGCDAQGSKARYEDAFTSGFANFSLPEAEEEGEGFDECRVFKRNDENDTCSADAFDRGHPLECASHVFDLSVYGPTLVTEFELACDEAWKVPMTESVFFGTVLVAAAVLGYLADALGRRHVLMGSAALLVAGRQQTVHRLPRRGVGATTAR